MQTISLCMIVKNEEETLARCLHSVHGIADEIVIADTGSTDGTKSVASRFTDRVYDFQWADDFSAARNFVFGLATMDYILWLDADDILLPKDRVAFLALKETLPSSVDAVMMRYNVRFDREGNPVFSYFRERLIRRDRHFRWLEPVHEYIPVGGRVRNEEIAVTHTKLHRSSGGRNIGIYERLLAAGRPLSPRGLYYYARELMDHGRTAEAASYFQSFLTGGLGWVEDNISACLALADCYRALGQPERQVLTLLRSFQYDTPRAEACCQLGYLYEKRNDYRRAAFWFGLAASLQKPDGSWGFFQPDCWDYLPNLELSVCYDRLGDLEKAEQYNELAARSKPDAFAVRYNRDYFQKRRQQAAAGQKGGEGSACGSPC